MDVTTRMGDGSRVIMSRNNIKEDVEAGMNDAAERGKIPVLTGSEVDELMDILCDPNRVVAISPGEEVVMTDDAGPMRIIADQGTCSGVGIPVDRVQAIQVHEKAFGMDWCNLGHVDYSFRPVKFIISQELHSMETVQLLCVIPVFYGAMPNLGTYFKVHGPFENPGDLYKEFKIKEAQESQEKAAMQAKEDMVWEFEKFYQIGADGINIDTTGAAGDPDFLASLEATREIKKITKNFDVEMGMASEYILGMHGELKFDGKRLAGMYPHEQVKVAEAAGVDIYGPVVNTNPTKSLAWNLARALTFIKECSRVAKIPIHPNAGMGVCGTPMAEVPPIDAVTRMNKALVRIGRVDGL